MKTKLNTHAEQVKLWFLSLKPCTFNSITDIRVASSRSRVAGSLSRVVRSLSRVVRSRIRVVRSRIQVV
jgi:hypothetical protein